jgi:hypothetical protein
MAFNIEKFRKAFFKHVSGMTQLEAFVIKINEIIDGTVEVEARLDGLEVSSGSVNSVLSTSVIISGTDVIVSDTSYVLDGTTYNPDDETIAVTAWAVNDRIDAVIGTADGIVLVEGTASASPVSPTIEADQVLLGYIFVTSTTTTAASNNIFYVSTLGNNSTGRKGNPLKPFLTITAVKALAVSGDEIWISPGTYTAPVDSLAKDGVIYRLFGATVYAGGEYLLNDGSINAFKVFGYGNSTLYQASPNGRFWQAYDDDTSVELHNLIVIDARNHGVVKGSFMLHNQTTGNKIVMKNVRITAVQTIIENYASSNIWCENCTFTTTGTGSSGHKLRAIVSGGDTKILFKSCTFQGVSSATGSVIEIPMILASPEITFHDCVILDTGDTSILSIGGIDIPASIKFAGTNILYGAASTASIYKSGDTAINPVIVGSLYTNIATTGVDVGDIFTYPVSSITVDADVTYTLPTV